jgi:hypothetical protein
MFAIACRPMLCPQQPGRHFYGQSMTCTALPFSLVVLATEELTYGDAGISEGG